jgi:hypothetical protein
MIQAQRRMARRREGNVNILMPGNIVFPDQHPALFPHGLLEFGERSHRWARDIEMLIDDRVIFAYEFTAQQTLFIHAVTSDDKAWRKNITKMVKRCAFFG